jgi:hypothetical protein
MLFVALAALYWVSQPFGRYTAVGGGMTIDGFGASETRFPARCPSAWHDSTRDPNLVDPSPGYVAEQAGCALGRYHRRAVLNVTVGLALVAWSVLLVFEVRSRSKSRRSLTFQDH